MPTTMRISMLQLRGHSIDQMDACEKEIVDAVNGELRNRPDIVLLPECAFPSYYLLRYDDEARRRCEGIVDFLSGASKRGRCYIACGLPETVVSEAGTRLYNSVICWAPDGEVAAIGRKRFLWHFDSEWFTPGTDEVVFDSPWGKIGLMVCADGRHPGAVRDLARRGARLVLNATNWVTSGRDWTTLSNPQVDYLVTVRAVENGVWVASANKVGMEEDFIVFCGCSMLVGPDGDVAVKASPDKPEVLRAEIPLDGQGKIAVPGHEIDLVAENVIGGHEPLHRRHIYTSVVQMGQNISSYGKEELLEQVRVMAEKLGALGAELVFVSEGHDAGTKCGLQDLDEAMEAFVGSDIMVYVAWETGKVLIYENGHRMGVAEIGSMGLVPCKHGPIGFMFDEKGLDPGAARSLMLRGAGTIVWFSRGLYAHQRSFVRARAMENRVFVVSARPGPPGESAMADPDGRILAEAFGDRPQIIAAYLDLTLTDRKTVVPGTNVLECLRSSRTKGE